MNRGKPAIAPSCPSRHQFRRLNARSSVGEEDGLGHFLGRQHAVERGASPRMAAMEGIRVLPFSVAEVETKPVAVLAAIGARLPPPSCARRKAPSSASLPRLRERGARGTAGGLHVSLRLRPRRVLQTALDCGTIRRDKAMPCIRQSSPPAERR